MSTPAKKGPPRKRQRSNPLAPQQRAHRRRQALGPDPICVRCGLRILAALRRVPRRLFEQHHYLGQQHASEETVIVCANCHAIFSSAQVDDAVQLTATQTSVERLFAMDGALGSLLRKLGEARVNYEPQRRAVIEGLDRDYPDWRTKSWAIWTPS